MKKNYPFFFLFFVLIINCSCPSTDMTPAYLILSIENFEGCLDVSNYNNTHEQQYDQKKLDAIMQQNFTDVCVSLNGSLLGYWPLPCTIPLRPDYTNKNNIRIIPCVRTPNTTTTTLQYLFVTPIDIEYNTMEREREYRLSNIQVQYVPSVDFPVLETFELSTDFKPNFPNLFPATIQIIPDEDLNKNIGSIILTDTAVFFDIVTSYFLLQGKGQRQFWEISYKTVNGQMVTILGYENTITGITHQDMIVLPSTEGVWKKLYVDITDRIMQASNIASQISTCLRITGTRNKTDIASEYYFENIKLITMDAPYY